MIGVFDSGFGGLAVLKHAAQSLPSHNFVYLADQAYVPYGTKTKQEIIDRSTKITSWLQSQSADTILIACNTATTLAIHTLRSGFDLPFVGVEPAAKPALTDPGVQSVSILATQATINTARLSQLIDKHKSPGQKVHKIALPQWVELVETKDLNSQYSKQLIKKTLDKQPASDAYVLACTHYLFLKPIIQGLKPEAKIFDPREGTSKRLKHLAPKPDNNTQQISFFTTQKSTKTDQLASRLWGSEISFNSVEI